MISLIRTRKYFFSLVLLSWVVGAALLWRLEQGDAVLFFSRHRSAWADALFVWGTRLGEPPAYLLVGLLLAFRNVRAALSLPVAGAVTTVASLLLKRSFSHDRPVAWFQKVRPDEMLTFVDGVQVYAGATSFPSGHSMSAFALFTLAVLWGSGRVGWQVGCFSLALLVAVSRIYLAQHFLQDVWVGSIIGLLLGVAVYAACAKWQGPPWLEWRLGLVKSSDPSR